MKPCMAERGETDHLDEKNDPRDPLIASGLSSFKKSFANNW